MPVDCSSCLVASSSTGVVGVRVCQFRPLLVSRRELVSITQAVSATLKLHDVPCHSERPALEYHCSAEGVLQGMLSNV